MSGGSGAEFDFWLGRWRGTWPANADTAAGSAVNTITKEYGGHVVYERFVAEEPEPFNGMSVSVFLPAEDVWKQTWVDDSGSYLDFVGGARAGLMDLRRDAVGPQGKAFMQRMLWFAIRPDAFEWEWQRSFDGGLEWETVWAISYTRLMAEPAACR
jgi:hypothetical protein